MKYHQTVVHRDVPANSGGEIPWVKTTEVKGIRINDTEEYITMSGLNNSSCKIYPKKSIIIAMYGQGKTRGNVGLLEIAATTNKHVVFLNLIKNMIVSIFLNY